VFCPEQIVVFESTGVRVLHELDPLYGVGAVRCDAPGHRVVFDVVERTWTSAGATIYVQDLEHGAPRAVATATTGFVNATFHPDGKSIVYATERDGVKNLWEQALAGGEPQQLTFGGGPDVGADVSRDGTRILFDVDVTARPIFEVSVEKPVPRRITMSLGRTDWMSVSHDGQWIVYQLEQQGRTRIILRSLETGVERVIGPGSSAVFGPDDETIYFAQGDRVVTTPRAGGPTQLLAKLPGQPRGLVVDKNRVVHMILFQRGQANAWRISTDGSLALESASHLVVIPAPAGDWFIALEVQQKRLEVVPPGGQLGAATNERLVHTFLAWDHDGRSYLHSHDNSIYRHFVDSKRDELVLPLGFDPIAVLPAPDGKTFYLVNAVGRVRRQLITNYGDRPRPP
jgi:dipeptidyl aminopeptidase/acylaminoacyl peptidase